MMKTEKKKEKLIKNIDTNLYIVIIYTNYINDTKMMLIKYVNDCK